MTPLRKEVIGSATLYLGDCMSILPELRADAVITDPPYGIGASSGVGKYGVMKWGGAADLGWDTKNAQGAFEALLALGLPFISWGGNHYATPPFSAVLIWDKGAGFEEKSFGEAEIAFTNLKGVPRIFKRDPLACGDYRQKQHPTQKPVALMEWCIQQAGMPETVLDPFMGAGSTGVACVHLSRKFIGVEIEPTYFDIACERIDNAQKQGRLFA